MQEIKEIIVKLLEKEGKLAGKLTKEEISSSIEAPKDLALGDFAFPCFKLSSIFKKNPVEIAKQLANEIKSKSPISQIKSAGPYLNFFIDKKIITQELFNNIDKDYGKSKEGMNKTIAIDFSGPNVGKPMHVGHIRSTIIGDTLMRTYDFLGYKPIGINYLGDVGLHIGKLIVAWELWLDKKALKEDPIAELLRLYVKFCENEKSEIQEGTEEGDDEKDYSNNEWTKKAKEKLKLIEMGDKKAHEIWKEIRGASGVGFDRVYSILKVNFNETTGQSKFGDAGKEIILNAMKKGLVKRDDSGALYVEFPNEKLPKKFVLRSNGTASYMTQDLGAAVERNKKYKFDEMIYITDYRQTLHFQQLFEILNMFGFDFNKKCKHLPFGTVNFGKEIFATREGKVILLEDVLKKTIEKAKQEIEKRNTKGDAEKVAIAAIKYIILRNEPIKNVEFSWDAALNFEGDSGPYLQYSYARASSIIKKAKKLKTKFTIPEKLEIKEIALIKKIEDFPSITTQVVEKLNPQLLANYSFQLAQSFSDFYTNCKVIGTKEESFRLKLIESFRITLKNALHLLGIEVMEEM